MRGRWNEEECRSKLKIRYRIAGAVKEVSASDENLLISEQYEDGRRVVEVKALRTLTLLAAVILFPRKYNKDDLFMMNGYQSWTETREFASGEQLNNLFRVPSAIQNQFHFREYGSQAFWPMRSGTHLGFDYAYIRGTDPLFIGSLNYRNAYLRIGFREGRGGVLLHSDVSNRRLLAGESFTVFDYIMETFGSGYFSRFRPRTTRKLFGYTSWYNHYQNINEKLILDALKSVDQRFDLFQIDDGFETHVGDWLDIDPVKFPDGLKPIVDRIHARGMLAGIWLAPFVAENSSDLVREHPDWIARDRNGRRVYAGCNWSGDCSLDLSIPEVVDYIRKVLRYYKELGFDFFKLDFLYASNLKRLRGKTHCETAEFAYGLLREELGDRLILGCGCTLSNAFGRFDYCRVGPDVSLKFDDEVYMRPFHPERVSTKVTLQNTIFRSSLDGHMFMNDPDVFMLRKENNSLTQGQRVSLTMINAMFGSLFMTSDDTGKYSEKQRSMLQLAMDYFQNGTVDGYERRGPYIIIHTRLHGRLWHYQYDTRRGLLRRLGQ